jgi:hypothetical protein
VAISVDPPEVSRDLSKKAGYTFSILSDPNAEVIRRYDLLHVGGGLTGMTLPGPQSSWWTRREWCVGSTSTEDVRVRARADEMLAARQRSAIAKHSVLPRQSSRPPIRFVPIKTEIGDRLRNNTVDGRKVD